MSNATSTVHYDRTGNSFYGVPSTGFCDATEGDFTVSRADITCVACIARVAS